MAQRRMFSKKVTDTDTFLDMPLSSQALYFHLNMHADDDGFIDNTKTIQRMIGSSEDDLKLLTAKQFIFPFETGVVVIKDWLVHNYIRKDTYNKTMYPNELEQLQVNDSGQYENQKFVTSTERPRLVDDTLTQVRLGKDRLGKDRLGKDRLGKDRLGKDRLGKDRLGKDSKDILSDSDEPDSKSIQKSERDQMFETIWKIYPKKSGKANAKKDFDKAIKSGIDPELIRSKLEEYLKQIKVKQTPQQFIKQGSTWFHQSGWEDEYDFTPEVRQTNGYGRQKREAVVPKFLKG